MPTKSVRDLEIEAAPRHGYPYTYEELRFILELAPYTLTDAEMEANIARLLKTQETCIQNGTNLDDWLEAKKNTV